MTQNAVDFLPEDYVERRLQQRTAVLFIALFIAVMGGIIAAYWVIEAGPRRAQAENDLVNQQYEDAAKPLAEMQEMRQQREQMMAKAEVTASLLERVPRSRLLGELTRMKPDGVMLLRLELTTKDIPAPQQPSKLDQAKAQEDAKPEPPKMMHDVQINLTGTAPSDGQVASYIEAMGESPLLKDVNLLYSEEFKVKDEMVRRFRVEMRLNPDADLTTSTTGK